jgi:hypothetical protein
MMFNVIMGMLLRPCDVQRGEVVMFLYGEGVFGSGGLFGYMLL